MSEVKVNKETVMETAMELITAREFCVDIEWYSFAIMLVFIETRLWRNHILMTFS